MKKLFIMAGLLTTLAFTSCEQPKETLSIIPVPLATEIVGGAFTVNEQTQLWIEAPEADKQILQWVSGSAFKRRGRGTGRGSSGRRRSLAGKDCRDS